MFLKPSECTKQIQESDLPNNIKKHMCKQINYDSLASDNHVYYLSPKEKLLIAIKYAHFEPTRCVDFVIDIYVFMQCDHINYVINKNIYISSYSLHEQYNVCVIGSFELSAYAIKYKNTGVIWVTEKTKFFDQNVNSFKKYPIEDFNDKMVNIEQIFASIIIDNTIGQSIIEYFKLIENELDVKYKRFNTNNDEINETILSTNILWPGYDKNSKGFTKFQFVD